MKARSRPLIPTGVSGGKPCAARFGSSSSGASPISPVTSIAAVPSGCSRSVAGPSASGVPSAARIGARGASSVSRFQLLAAAQAGEDEVGRPVDPAFRPGQVELVFDLAEGDGLDHQRHRDDRLAGFGAGVLGLVGDEAALRRDLAALRGSRRRTAWADRFLRGVVQLRVHRREVLRAARLRRSGSAAAFSGDPGAPMAAPTTKATSATTPSGSRARKQSSTTLNLGRPPAHRWKGNRAVRRMLVFGG